MLRGRRLVLAPARGAQIDWKMARKAVMIFFSLLLLAGVYRAIMSATLVQIKSWGDPRNEKLGKVGKLFEKLGTP